MLYQKNKRKVGREMTIVEIFLILIGVILVIGSFFVSEKLSDRDLEHISEMSEREIGIVMEKELEEAKAKISDIVDDSLGLSIGRVNQVLAAETDDRIAAIGEYSDTVLENINKANNEVTFLYSMLGDKHEELNKAAADITGLVTNSKADIESVIEVVRERLVQESLAIIQDQRAKEQEELARQKQAREAEEAAAEEHAKAMKAAINHNDEIIKLYVGGMQPVDIAKKLGLGYGEVSLVIELFSSKIGQIKEAFDEA